MTTKNGRGHTFRIATLVLIPAVTGCASRDIARAKEAVPHQKTETSAPQHPAPPAPPTAPVPPTPPTASIAPTPLSTPPESPTQLLEVFPHVRVDAAKKLVEFDAIIPIHAHDPQKPRVYLEVIACPPDTKEHEALLLTRAKPSHVHAALLLIALEPGAPGQWNWEGEELVTTPPKGPKVSVEVSYKSNGRTLEVNPTEWVLDVNTNKTLAELEPSTTWVFAGSQMIARQAQDTYRADADGTLIGLHSFGGETLAWPVMYNPDSAVEEPRWIANARTVPPYDTPVTVRIRPEATGGLPPRQP